METKSKVDFSRTLGRIKPMHAVGQPPFTGGFSSLNFEPMQALTDAHIPFRLTAAFTTLKRGAFRAFTTPSVPSVSFMRLAARWRARQRERAFTHLPQPTAKDAP